VCQQPPDRGARGSPILGTEPLGHFQTEFSEAVATQRYVAIGGTLTRQCDDQRTRRGLDGQWSTAAWTILQTIAAAGHKAREPTADGGATQLLLASKRAAAQTGCAAQDHARPTDESLWGRASSHPGGQLVGFGSSQLD